MKRLIPGFIGRFRDRRRIRRRLKTYVGPRPAKRGRRRRKRA